MFCLDTNIIIGVMTRRATQALERHNIECSLGTRLAIPTPVLFELYYGAMKSAFPERNLARLRDYFSAGQEILNFDEEDAREAGDIRAHLERVGTPVGPYDLLIAAQARRRQAVLVTANRREFERVPGLMVTNWAV